MVLIIALSQVSLKTSLLLALGALNVLAPRFVDVILSPPQILPRSRHCTLVALLQGLSPFLRGYGHVRSCHTCQFPVPAPTGQFSFQLDVGVRTFVKFLCIVFLRDYILRLVVVHYHC